MFRACSSPRAVQTTGTISFLIGQLHHSQCWTAPQAAIRRPSPHLEQFLVEVLRGQAAGTEVLP